MSLGRMCVSVMDKVNVEGSSTIWSGVSDEIVCAWVITPDSGGIFALTH